MHVYVATALKMKIVGGWLAFASDNRLHEGEYGLGNCKASQVIKNN